MHIDEFINAAKRNDMRVIETYIANGFNIDSQDEYGFTAIIEAAEFGNNEMFWKLIDYGANIHLKAEDNYSILHAIGIGGNVSMLEYALRNGISKEDKVSGGEQMGMGLKEYANYGKNDSILKWIEDNDKK